MEVVFFYSVLFLSASLIEGESASFGNKGEKSLAMDGSTLNNVSTPTTVGPVESSGSSIMSSKTDNLAATPDGNPTILSSTSHTPATTPSSTKTLNITTVSKTTTPATTTTTPPPTTETTTTPPPTTTTTHPTTTTTHPTTTTTHPTTTTTHPTTTTTHPTTTTTHPTTTTTLPPTTTVPPIPPSYGTWYLNSSVNVSCIILRMDGSFVVPYHSGKNETLFATVKVPISAAINGSCPRTMMLLWPNSLGKTTTLVMEFGADVAASGDKYYLKRLLLDGFMDNITFPNASGLASYNVSYSSSDAFLTAVNSSYRCFTPQNISADADAVISLKDFQFEAFKSSGSSFDKEHVCYMDEITSDIVPIAVGCTLAGLVVIVMVSYIIGRRRARTRGYQSV